ncbi:MAG: type VI secretion system contractile sheath large subunit [Candidatus Zixiibacteriota bacterium]|nr:MAG: type VI secretion system contractile sheath large subunit [candidate division Zixibacteria bacterium]
MSQSENKAAAPEAAPAPQAQPSAVEELLDMIHLGEEELPDARLALRHFLEEYVKVGLEQVRIPLEVVDGMIAELDQKLSRQMSAILHHPDFQKLESAWRALKFLVDQSDPQQNVKIEILNVSKESLTEDFKNAPDVVTSGLYKQVYTQSFGTYGGEPYGLLVGNYDFGCSTPDMFLLNKLAAVATMAHAPFVAAAAPDMFGMDSFAGLPSINNLHALFETERTIKWRKFRESEDSRNVGLAMPRFLLREPYNARTNPVKSFHFQEEAQNDERDFLWGNAACAFATRVVDSFARYRISANIIGPQGGGAVENLPLHFYEAMGNLQTKIPTEILISDRREFELSEEGFIPLTMRKGSDCAAFFSANSCQLPRKYPDTEEGHRAETNYKMGTQLPYTFIVSRLAHYIKVIQRENLGTFKDRGQLEQELNKWIRQYVTEDDQAQEAVRARRPLRKAQIMVSEVENDPGWYRVEMKVQPFIKYMGAFFELSLVGKLDKKVAGK